VDGWVKFHRKMLEWEWFTDVNTCHLFTYCLLRANITDSSFRGVQLSAGEFVSGRKSLAENTGLTEMQVRTSLDKLVLTNEVTIKVTNKFSIISIVNWKSYQVSNQQDNQQVTNKQPTSNQQVTTEEEYKNIRKKEEKEIIEVPDWISETDWNDFSDMRKKLKKPMTNRAAGLVIGKLEKLRMAGHDVNEILQQSIVNSWQDVYAPKTQGQYRQQSQPVSKAQQRENDMLEATARGAMNAMKGMNHE